MNVTARRWAVAVAAMAMIAGCSAGTRVNRENYDRIATGMTRAEVVKILGEGKSTGSAGVALPGIEGSVAGYVWETADGQRTITVQFANDKVVSKTQSGL